MRYLNLFDEFMKAGRLEKWVVFVPVQWLGIAKHFEVSYFLRCCFHCSVPLVEAVSEETLQSLEHGPVQV